MRTALFWVITQQVAEISHQCIGTTYWFRGQEYIFLGGFLTHEEGCTETPVRNYNYTSRINPEEHSSHAVDQFATTLCSLH